MEDIKIIKLMNSDCEEFNTICDWMYEWWGKKDNWSLEKVREYMKNSMCSEHIPQTFIATIENELVGMYQISMNDLDVRPDIYPWLINVYVLPKYRGLGICRKIVESSILQAEKLKLDQLFLYTKHIGLYEKFGFKFISEIKTFKDDSMIERLYKIDLN